MLSFLIYGVDRMFAQGSNFVPTRLGLVTRKEQQAPVTAFLKIQNAKMLSTDSTWKSRRNAQDSEPGVLGKRDEHVVHFLTQSNPC